MGPYLIFLMKSRTHQFWFKEYFQKLKPISSKAESNILDYWVLKSMILGFEAYQFQVQG